MGSVNYLIMKAGVDGRPRFWGRGAMCWNKRLPWGVFWTPAAAKGVITRFRLSRARVVTWDEAKAALEQGA